MLHIVIIHSYRVGVINADNKMITLARIAYSYHLEEDVIIKSLYEKYKHGFENMQEFIAECFMASELTNEVTLSNNVKNRINEIAEVKN